MDARHNQRVFLKREHLADGVVTAHGDDALGAANERGGFGKKFQQLEARPGRRKMVQEVFRAFGHVGTGHDQAGGVARQVRPRKGLGQCHAVLSAA